MPTAIRPATDDTSIAVGTAKVYLNSRRRRRRRSRRLATPLVAVGQISRRVRRVGTWATRTVWVDPIGFTCHVRVCGRPTYLACLARPTCLAYRDASVVLRVA